MQRSRWGGSRRQPGTGTGWTLLCHVACAALCALALTCPARASSSSAVDAIAAHLRARGASRVREVAQSFLFEGQSTAVAQRLERAGCVAYLAFGAGEVRDVDLGLYTDAGQLIAEDVAVAPYAYARVCGASGLRLQVSASLYAGRGQLTLLRVDDAPRELGRLPESVALAVSAGGSLEELRSVGVALDEFSPDASLLQEERSHLAMGYAAASAPLALELRAGSARGELLLRASSCYRISTVVPLSRGVAMEIEAPNALRWATRSLGEDRAAIALCAPVEGTYHVRVQARPLRGVAVVRAFEHRDITPTRVRELGEASALAVAEAESVARARGLRLIQLGHAWVEGSAPLAWPLVIGSAGCHALAVVSEVGAAAVDVRLTDAQGVLLAHNEGRRGVPMVFFCVREGGPVRLILKARGPDLRVSIWLGRPEERQP